MDRLKRAEWQQKYNITDEEFERIDLCLKVFGGMIVEVENPPLEYEIIKFDS